MNKRIGAALLVGVLSAGGVAVGGAPAAAAESMTMEKYELPAWQQRRIDRAERWLQWSLDQVEAGTPERAFQGFRRAVLEVRGIEAGSRYLFLAVVWSEQLAGYQLRQAEHRMDSTRDQQLVNQAERLHNGGTVAWEGGGNLLAIEKFRRSFLRVAPVVPQGLFYPLEGTDILDQGMHVGGGGDDEN